jgi:Protein of unknown function (DUF3987)
MSPRDGAAEIRRLVAVAPEMTARDTWSEPDMRLVEDDRAAAPVLDDDALPAGWSGWIDAEATARGCPRDYIAAGLIVAASELIGNARHVAATDTWVEAPHLWIALIGAPSTGKSPAIRSIVEAMRVIEREAEPAWREACAKHAALVEAARVIEDGWRQSVREAAKRSAAPPNQPPGADAPPAPPAPRVMAMDATTEELQHLLAGQPRGLLYMRDELAGWLGNHDRYGGHGADRAFYVEAWNGGAYVADRVKHRGVPVRIERTSLAILGGMQPDRLRETLAGADDGLAARFLYVWPEPVPIAPLDGNDAEVGTRRHRLISAARRLYGLAIDGDPAGDPVPRILPLDSDALALFDEVCREAMERAQSSRGLAAGWHGKTPGRALRLALVYELLAWSSGAGSEPRTVSADAMARAAGYLDCAAAMLDRVTAGLAIGRAEADAAVIARHVLAIGARALNERVLYQQPGWAWLRDRDRRAEAFRVLVDAGWIRSAERPGHGRPRGDWDVSPRLREATR